MELNKDLGQSTCLINTLITGHFPIRLCACNCLLKKQDAVHNLNYSNKIAVNPCTLQTEPLYLILNGVLPLGIKHHFCTEGTVTSVQTPGPYCSLFHIRTN